MNKKGQLGARQVIINLGVVLVVTLYILLFMVSYLTVTNPNSELLSDDRLADATININNSVNSFTSTSESAYTILDAVTTPSVDNAILIFKEAFDIPKSFLSFLFNGIVGINDLIVITFGGGAVGYAVSLALNLAVASFLVTVVFLFIKFLRTGESER